jgi:ppGpp synthetase/RelA/SpoT-type nucleotidyltranferase
MSTAGGGRPSEAEYPAWATATFGADFSSDEAAASYALNVSAALNNVQESSFWQDLSARLDALAAKYRDTHKADLSPGPFAVALTKKPYASVVDKSYRLNVNWNKDWPDPPGKSGWITDTNLYSHMDDLLRTTIVCNFLDGPEFITTDLAEAAKQKGLVSTTKKLSRNEGYYAHHLHIAFGVDVFLRSIGMAKQDLRVEIQVTTQPQEMLRNLTHPYYREQRLQPPGYRDETAWKFKTNRFRARYLSHALHLLEAMILDVRDNPDDHD